jgi:hypothetical protein
MTRLLIVPALALALAGCTLDQFYQVEADALAVVAQIKARVPVIAAQIDATIIKVCNALPAVNASIMSIAAAIPNPGPKTQNALRNGNNAMIGAAAACDAYALARPSEKPALLLQLWAGYNAGKAAAVAAHAAGAT